MSRKNILFLTSTLMEGGSEEIIFNLCKYLNPQKYNIYVASVFDGPMRDILEAHQIRCLKVAGKNKAEKMQHIANWISKLGIEYIFCSYIPQGHLIAPPKTQSIEIVHGPYDWLIDDEEYISALQRSSLIICVSESVYHFMLKHFRTMQNKLIIINNGIDPAKLVTTISKAEMKEQLTLPHDAIVVGNLGRISPTKGIDRIIEVARILTPQYDNLYFVIPGDYNRDRAYFDSITAKIKEYQLSHIIFPGFIKNVGNLLQIYDIFIFPSFVEGLPLALIEALKMGIPTVMTNIGIVNYDPHMIDGQIGYIINEYTDKEFSEKLKHLIDDKELRLEIGQRNKAIFTPKYSVTEMVRQYEILLDHLKSNYPYQNNRYTTTKTFTNSNSTSARFKFF